MNRAPIELPIISGRNRIGKDEAEIARDRWAVGADGEGHTVADYAVLVLGLRHNKRNTGRRTRADGQVVTIALGASLAQKGDGFLAPRPARESNNSPFTPP